MGPPSYARATASSTRRTRLHPSGVKDTHPSNSCAHGQNLDKAETKGIKVYPKQAIKQPTPKSHGGARIHHERSWLTSLPTELQSLIYEYSFPSKSVDVTHWYTGFGNDYNHLLWPALLRVSRAVRDEAAFAFYSRTTFTATINKLDFSVVTDWVNRLPPDHQGYLSRNQNLRIVMDLNSSALWYRFKEPHPQDNQVLAFLCRRFGSVHSLPNQIQKLHFLHFCRLADWSLWCSHTDRESIHWQYGTNSHNMFSLKEDTELLWEFLRDCLSSPLRPCVEKNWIYMKQKKRMKKELLNMVEQFDQTFMAIRNSQLQQRNLGDADIQRWGEKVDGTRRCLEKW